MGNPKSLSAKDAQNPTWKLCQIKQTGVKRLTKEGMNKTKKKVSKQNTNRESQKLFGDPPNFKNTFTWWTSSSSTFCKKEEIKEANSNGMPKTQIPSKRQQKSMKEEKPRDKQKHYQTKHL